MDFNWKWEFIKKNTLEILWCATRDSVSTNLETEVNENQERINFLKHPVWRAPV
jgi:hypothetical protein